MASKTNIGAVIGLEGARQYNTDLANVIAKTKLLKAEYKELATTFDKNRSKWSDIAKSSKALGDQAQATAQKLKVQSDALLKMQELGKGANQTWDQYYQALAKQAEAVNKTQAEYNELMRTIENLPSKLEFAAEKINKISSGLKPIGDFMTKTVTLPFVAAMTGAVKTAIDYETAFIGVQKTTNEIIDQNGNLVYSYKDLERELVELSKYTASDMSTIFKTAEISGQMGILTDQIPKFTKYMIAMGDATNLSAEEAASYISTILNLMNKGMPIAAEQAKQVGDAIVYLGNNFNTTESDIAHMAARLAPGAALVGLTTDNVLALATAMSEAKITAEGGGTAMTQVLQKVHKSYANFMKGAESDLPELARVANMSAEEFAYAWKTKPITALEAFIKGLSRLDEEGEYTSLVLDDLDMAGIRQNLTMSALSLTADRLSTAIGESNREFEDGNALLEEAQKFWDSSEGKMIQFKNSLTRLGNSFGKEVLPYITEFVEGLTKMIDKFAELPSESKQNIIKFVGALALLGPGIKTITSVSDGIAGIMKSIDNLKNMGGLKGFADDLTTAANAADKLAGTTGTTGIGAIGAALGKTLGLATVFGAAWYYIFSKDWEATQKWADELEASVGGACQDWDTYGLTVSTVLDETGAYATESIAKTSEIIKTNSNDTTRKVQEDLIDMKAGVRGNLTEMSDIVKYNFQVAETAMKNSTSNARNHTKIEFDAMSNDIILTTDGLGRTVPAKYKAMADTLKTEGTGIRREFKMVMTGIEDDASSVNLNQSGSHMMDSLANGIRNAAHRVYSAASGVARGIAAYLQFSEPEKGPLSNFHTAMPDMMKLMAQGINDNAYLVEDALANVAGGMRNEVGNQSFNYGGVVINMNVPEGANGQMLVDEIEQELAQRTLRRKAVFG